MSDLKFFDGIELSSLAFNVVFTLIFTSLKTYKSCLKLKIFFKYGILNYLSEKKNLLVISGTHLLRGQN